MNILPVKLISEVDQPIFGASLLNLAKLQRLDFPLPPGIAIAPLDVVLRTLMEHFHSSEKEVFEQRLEIVKKEIFKIPPPKELEKELNELKKRERGKIFLVNEEAVNKKNLVWPKLLKVWLDEICLLLWKQGFNQEVLHQLKAQTIFLVDKKFEKVTALFDPDLKDVVIKTEVKLSPPVLKEINELVIEGNKKLFLPQVYRFLVLKEKVYLVGLFPFTQTLPVSQETAIVIPQKEQKQLLKSAVKLFLNLSTGFTIENSADGVLIEGEKVADFYDRQNWFDKTAFKLAEGALSFSGKSVIFKLPDLKDGEIRGTLRLLNQESLFKDARDVFMFVRTKKMLLNLELAIPLVRSVDEFLEMKKKLAGEGVYRKGTLKFWLEIGVPENLINLEDYIEAGFDGAMIDLDELQKFLGGYEAVEGEFYKKQASALIKFLTPAFKTLHQAKIPILVKGGLAVHHEVLDFLIEAGVWGIVVNTALEVESFSEHLRWTERRMVLKRLA